MDQQSGRDVQAMKLLELTSKAIKLLVTVLVVQCRNILPLASGQYIPTLTSHSVDKSTTGKVF